jgi:hypothetical protein
MLGPCPDVRGSGNPCRTLATLIRLTSGKHFSKILYIVALYRIYTRALTFEIFFCVCGSPTPKDREQCRKNKCAYGYKLSTPVITPDGGDYQSNVMVRNFCF